MSDEIVAAADWWTDILTKSRNPSALSAHAISKFHTALKRQLYDCLIKFDPDMSDWRHDDPMWGSFGRSYAASTEDGVSPTSPLGRAASEAHISDIQSRLPHHTLMWINPGYVEVATEGVIWGAKLEPGAQQI